MVFKKLVITAVLLSRLRDEDYAPHASTMVDWDGVRVRVTVLLFVQSVGPLRRNLKAHVRLTYLLWQSEKGIYTFLTTTYRRRAPRLHYFLNFMRNKKSERAKRTRNSNLLL